MSKLFVQASSVIASKGFSGVTVTEGSFPPAAFTRIVGFPSSAVISARAFSRLARSEASVVTKRALPPAFTMEETRSSPRSLLRPATTTVAPAAANPSARDPPRTPVAPMTTAVSPERLNGFSREAFIALELSELRRTDQADCGVGPALVGEDQRGVGGHHRSSGEHELGIEPVAGGFVDFLAGE